MSICLPEITEHTPKIAEGADERTELGFYYINKQSLKRSSTQWAGASLQSVSRLYQKDLL